VCSFFHLRAGFLLLIQGPCLKEADAGPFFFLLPASWAGGRSVGEERPFRRPISAGLCSISLLFFIIQYLINLPDFSISFNVNHSIARSFLLFQPIRSAIPASTQFLSSLLNYREPPFYHFQSAEYGIFQSRFFEFCCVDFVPSLFLFIIRQASSLLLFFLAAPKLNSVRSFRRAPPVSSMLLDQ